MSLFCLLCTRYIFSGSHMFSHSIFVFCFCSPSKFHSLPCIPGEYQDIKGQPACKQCAVNTASVVKGREDACPGVDKGSIVLGGTTPVKVPGGSYLTNCSAGACRSFEQCPAGWFGGTTANKQCKVCIAGKTSPPASTACKSCAKGKFGEILKDDGSSVCIDCKRGYFQPGEPNPTVCNQCPVGFKQLEQGESSCVDELGIKPKACKSSSC